MSKIQLITKEEVDKVLNEGIREIDRRLYSILNEEYGISDKEVVPLCSAIEKYVVNNKEIILNSKDTTITHSFPFHDKTLYVNYR